MSWFYKGAQNLSDLSADYVSVSTLSVSGNFSLPALSQYTPLYVDSTTNVVATPLGTGGYLKATGAAPYFQLSVPNSDVDGGTNNAIAVYTGAGVLSSSTGTGYPKLTAGVPAYSATVPIADISGGTANRMAVFSGGGALSSSSGSGYAKFATGVPNYASTVPIADVSGGSNNTMAIYTAGGVLSSSAGSGYIKLTVGVPGYSGVVPISDVSGGSNNTMAIYTAGGVLSSSVGSGYVKLTVGVPGYSAVVPIADVTGGTNNTMAVYTGGGVLSSSSGSGYAKFSAGVPLYSATIPAADVTGAFSPGAITGGTADALAVYNGTGVLGSSSGTGYVKATAGVPGYISSVPTSDVSGNFSNYRIAGGASNALAVYDGSGILSQSTGNGYANMTAGVPGYSTTIPFSDVEHGNNFAAAVYTNTGVLTSTATPANHPASGLDIAYGQVLYAPDNVTVPRWSTGPITNTWTARDNIAATSVIIDTYSSTVPSSLLSIQSNVPLTLTTDMIGISCKPVWTKSAGGTISNIYDAYFDPKTNITGGSLLNRWGVYINAPSAVGGVSPANAVSLRVNHPTYGLSNVGAWLESVNIGTGYATLNAGDIRVDNGTQYGTVYFDVLKKVTSSAAVTNKSVWMQPVVGANPMWVAGALCPAGSIIAFGGRTAPLGWLLCDGSAYSVDPPYADLAAALYDSSTSKYAYGCNNANAALATQFYVPDLRGRFIRGTDTRGATGNDPDYAGRTANGTNGNTTSNPGSQQADAYRTHTHTTTSWVHYSQTGAPWANPAGGAITQIGYIGVGAPSGGNVSNNETRPVNVFCTYIIKY